MIQPNELRIGNWVNFKHNGVDWGKVQINTNFFRHYEQEEYVNEPIPLTEEWLIKFDFRKGIKEMYCDNEFEFSIGIDHVMIFYKGLYLIHCEHVHTLQNLFFALKQKELTIK
jgi:hypothetical protein